MSILLEAEHLTKIFTQRGKNPFKAVNDVSFTLKKGETLGIVGESGSGKSTIAKLLTRLTDITEGTLKFEGKDITRLKQSQLKEVYGDIQMVFQNPVGSFDPRRTLGDGIGESLRNRGMKKADVEKRVAELLEQCGLEKEYAKRYPHEVSGGQCQRAAIARALAVEPKVLICDEATSALDPATTQSILQLLKDINKRLGLTILLITHEMEVVKRICDRVAVIDKGELIETGSVSEIFSNPKTALAQIFIQSTFHIELPQEYMEQLSAQPSAEKNKPIIKFEFTGRSVDAPLLSHASKRFGIDFSILMSQIDYAGGVKFGFVIAEVTGEEDAISEARFYLIDNNVKVEVLGYVE